MQVFFGTLSLRGLDSYLLPQDAWLLMSGFPDHRQAAVAATNFIVNIRNLEDGANVAVIGDPTLVDERLAIILSEVNAAGKLMDHALDHPLYREQLAVMRSGGHGGDYKSKKVYPSTPSQPKKTGSKKSGRK